MCVGREAGTGPGAAGRVRAMHAISIALCTYNGERFLAEQLHSLRAQEGVSEIVVVDDGSTDGTWAILEAHAREDRRLRLNRNPAPLGITGNFERALQLVTTPWVALADQDDVWRPEKMARLRAAWDGRAGLLHHATLKFRSLRPATVPSPAGEGHKFTGSDVRRLLFRNSVVGHTTLLRTELARRLMPFPRRVPHDWWLGAGAAATDRVQYVDEYLVYYRIHDHNAYHAVGSRWRRAGAEHWLRLELLRALTDHPGLSPVAAEFADDYRRLLEATRGGTFPWALWRFYRQQAALLFGDLPATRRLRKTFFAALGAMLRADPVHAGELERPVVPVEPAELQPVRRTG